MRTEETCTCSGHCQTIKEQIVVSAAVNKHKHCTNLFLIALLDNICSWNQPNLTKELQCQMKLMRCMCFINWISIWFINHLRLQIQQFFGYPRFGHEKVYLTSKNIAYFQLGKLMSNENTFTSSFQLGISISRCHMDDCL